MRKTNIIVNNEGSIIGRLKDANVVTFKKTSGNEFRVRERCDRYFQINLTKCDLLKLSHELIEMSES